MPRWAQSIRFRLSLAYALAVFAAGTVLLATLYFWQVRQLEEPILVRSRPAVARLADGAQLDGRLVTQDDLTMAFLEQFEREAYRNSLDEQRKASLIALGVLAVVAFGSGWVLSGWTLRPMGKMVAVAREISGTELSRRIDLKGPDDELKDLADTFDEMLDRLQASFEDQRRFVQDASHELRNPLAVTQTNLELVLDDPEAGIEDLREAARIAYASSGRVGTIVDELIDQARSGVPSGAVSTVELGAVVAAIADDFAASGTSRGLCLDVDEQAPEVVVRGDAAALRRAVANLVTNAVRLAPADSTILLTVGIENDLAFISVTDEGPGISPDDQERIFDRFWRGDDSGKGLGLGLSIVRQIAERHGGRVDLVSESGVGSTFTLRVPIPVARP